MREQNQNQNSTLPDFDDELNDMLVRRYILCQTYRDLINNAFSTIEHNDLMIESLVNEVKDIESEIVDYIKGEEDNG